jgi:MurNAc alpha-1-phosphate uridylyltransferase
MKAMILAAGRGTRMAPLTDTCPKPLIPLCGKPLIIHHLEKLAAAGITDIVINHAWLGEQLEQTLGNGSSWGIKIQYSPENEALETGGGVYQALPLLGEDAFLLINGDVWTNWDYSEVMNTSLQEGELGHLWLIDNPAHNPQGDFCLGEGKVLDTAFLNEAALTFSGISLLSPQLWAECTSGAYPLAPMLRSAMLQQQITGSKLNADWVDVGTPQRLSDLEQRLCGDSSA